MANTPSGTPEVLGDSLARGIVRHSSKQKVAQILEILAGLAHRPGRGSIREGAVLRRVCRGIEQAFRGCVLLQSIEKKAASFLVVVPADDRDTTVSHVMGIVLRKKKDVEVFDTSIRITGHFLQRVLQDTQKEGCLHLKDLFAQVFRHFSDLTSLDGPIWLHHTLGLAIADVTREDEADAGSAQIVFKSFIGATKLDPSKLVIWEKLSLRAGHLCGYRPNEREFWLRAPTV